MKRWMMIASLAQSTRAIHPVLPPVSLASKLNLRSICEATKIPEAKEGPRSVPARTAYELLQAGYRYLDVRTADEFRAGHPVGAINIPYQFQTNEGMSKNLKFVEEVSSVFKKDDQIVVGCRIGKRSLMAATDLSSAGFTSIVDLAGGYTAWRNDELPVNDS